MKKAYPTKRPNGFFFLLWMLCSGSLTAAAQHADEQLIRTHIEQLASDDMKGRGTGSRELRKAARYIVGQFKKYGLAPGGPRRQYDQPFTARVSRVVVKAPIPRASNLLGFIDNRAPYTIVIGAHYDHLGLGMQGGSKDPEPSGKIHNGADDNASGVAGLLELARYFSQNNKTEPYNLLFIAFSAEELGLLGSRYFVEHPTIPLQQLHFMFNMDMIGRYQPDRGLGIGGYGTSPLWPEIVEGIQTPIRYFTDNAGKGGSDHHSFYMASVPILFFHTGGHPDYHAPGDDPDKIDYRAMAQIVNLGIQLIERAMEKNKLPFTAAD